MQSIIGLSDWFQTPPGRYLLAWERAQYDAAVSDVFGYHALQLGLPELDALSTNRMPHRWLAMPDQLADSNSNAMVGKPPNRLALMTDFSALPFPASSLDLLVLPHSLEVNVDPHATLREAERVLVPEGRIVISGLNPTSLWGLSQRRAHVYRRLGFGDLYLPQAGEFIGYWRLRDWLRLLNFEVETVHFGAYRPAVSSEKWLHRYEWMDAAGARWWPIFGAAYFLVAVKRVRGTRLMGAPWKPAMARAATSATATRHRANKVNGPSDKL